MVVFCWHFAIITAMAERTPRTFKKRPINFPPQVIDAITEAARVHGITFQQELFRAAILNRVLSDPTVEEDLTVAADIHGTTPEVELEIAIGRNRRIAEIEAAGGRVVEMDERGRIQGEVLFEDLLSSGAPDLPSNMVMFVPQVDSPSEV